MKMDKMDFKFSTLGQIEQCVQHVIGNCEGNRRHS
jgi:hypothetical protein